MKRKNTKVNDPTNLEPKLKPRGKGDRPVKAKLVEPPPELKPEPVI